MHKLRIVQAVGVDVKIRAYLRRGGGKSYPEDRPTFQGWVYADPDLCVGNIIRHIYAVDNGLVEVATTVAAAVVASAVAKEVPYKTTKGALGTVCRKLSERAVGTGDFGLVGKGQVDADLSAVFAEGVALRAGTEVSLQPFVGVLEEGRREEVGLPARFVVAAHVCVSS